MAKKKEEGKKSTSKKKVTKEEGQTRKANVKSDEKSVSSKKIKKESIKEVVKTDSTKKDYTKLNKFFNFVDKYRVAIYSFVGGILLTTLVVILIWPDRIAKLSDGTEPVASIEGLTVTADDLYEDMKEIYSISLLLDKIDNKILEEKYPETDEMNDELQKQAEDYYNVYEQYQGQTKEEFLASNGFGSEKAFIEYLRLIYRRNKYAENYIRSLVTDKEVDQYYKDKVFGDINTEHILVKVASNASDDDKKKAEDLAKEIISKLNDGKTFDEVKEEYKDSITYEKLGYKSYNANLESAYMEEMEKLENNSYSKTPVKTSYGYHVVHRIDQKEKPSLEDIKDEIIESLAAKKAAEDANLQYIALDKMRQDAKLTFTDTVLEKKYNTYIEKYR